MHGLVIVSITCDHVAVIELQSTHTHTILQQPVYREVRDVNRQEQLEAQAGNVALFIADGEDTLCLHVHQ